MAWLGARRRPPSRTASGAVVEVLRLLFVVFFAGLGYQLGHVLQESNSTTVIGPFGWLTVGSIIGCGTGFVVGGVVGRSASTAAELTVSSLREVSADSMVAGGFGAVVGAMTGVVIGWPTFFIPQRLLSIPLFGIVLVLLAQTGYRVGAAHRDDVLALFTRSTVPPRRATASARPRMLDTSVAVDARILEVVRAGFMHGRTIVIEPVIGELHQLADGADPVRRARGRRGLELLDALRREPAVDLEVVPDPAPDLVEVDAKLVRGCLDGEYALLTLDTNLAKVAMLSGVTTQNLHALSLALRPPVVAGEDVTVQVIKVGREPGQGVGYLDDGTMVIVERGRALVGKDVAVRVSSVVTTANGRLVFASLTGSAGTAVSSA